MAILSNMMVSILAATALAQPHRVHNHKRTSCDLGIPGPASYPAAVLSQWCSMISTEITSLKTKEDPTIMMPSVEAQYKQANIHADPASSLPNVHQILEDPQARKAMERMKAAYPQTGSPDLTAADIQEVYAEAIEAAVNKTGIPQEMIVSMIWTESKGHPLVYQGLTQMDYVAWGQMVDENPELKNRYLPTSNIVAASMFLAKAKQQYGGSWEECYKNHYQDPTA